MKWLDISGWEGAYQVSDGGRVRSLDRMIVAGQPHGGRGERSYKGRMLTAYVSGSGYPIVSFTGPGKKREYHNVHRLVLEAFVGPCPPTMECCHYDGNRTNNKLTNLRWDTRSNNALDANRHGTRNAAKGEDAHWAKLTEKNVKYIRANVDKLGQREMGRMFGVTHGTIGLVLKGQTWKHVK